MEATKNITHLSPSPKTKEIEKYMDDQLNILADYTDPSQLYECHKYVTDTIDWFLFTAIDMELYESAENIKLLRSIIRFSETNPMFTCPNHITQTKNYFHLIH